MREIKKIYLNPPNTHNYLLITNKPSLETATEVYNIQ